MRLRKQDALFRMFQIVIQGFAQLNRGVFRDQLPETYRQIQAAGISRFWLPEEYLARMQLITLFVLPVFLYFGIYFLGMMGIVVAIVLCGVTFWLLRRRLRNQAHRRLVLIKRRLPFFLDLLTLLIEAGSSFLLALKQAVAEFEGHPVANEFGQRGVRHEHGQGSHRGLRQSATAPKRRRDYHDRRLDYPKRAVGNAHFEHLSDPGGCAANQAHPTRRNHRRRGGCEHAFAGSSSYGLGRHHHLGTISVKLYGVRRVLGQRNRCFVKAHHAASGYLSKLFQGVECSRFLDREAGGVSSLQDALSRLDERGKRSLPGKRPRHPRQVPRHPRHRPLLPSGYYPPGFQAADGPPTAAATPHAPTAEPPVAPSLAPPPTPSAPPVETNNPPAPPNGKAHLPVLRRPLPFQSTPVQESSKSSAEPPVPSPPPTLQSPAQRKVKVAKFVSGGATNSRINLGEDGQLPEFVVEEGAKHETAPSESQTSRPLVLAIALCLSAAVSVLMLFVDTEPQQSKSQRKLLARQHLAEYYIGDGTQPYQELIRQALADMNHGDRKSAQQKLRRVLEMLHSEGHSESIGLTGPKSAVAPPSDTGSRRTAFHPAKQQVKRGSFSRLNARKRGSSMG